MPACTPNPPDPKSTGQSPWADPPTPPIPPTPHPNHEHSALETQHSPPLSAPTPPTAPSTPHPDLQDTGPSTQDSPTLPAPLSPTPPSTPDPDSQHSALTAQHSPALPTLSPSDAALLDLFITAHESLHALAQSTSQSLRAVTAWADSPTIAPWITRLRAERTHHRRGLSLAYLESILATTPDPIEGRRAANSLLKHTTPARRATRRATESTAQAADSVPINHSRTTSHPHHPLTPTTPHQPVARPSAPRTQDPGPPPPPPPTLADLFSPAPNRLAPIPNQLLPHPSHPPETIANTILAALTTPDTPTPGAGAIALHNFHHRNAYDRRTDAPARTLAELTGQVPDAFIIKSIQPGHFIPGDTSGWSAHEAIIETQANERLLLRINLHQPTHGTFGNCWMLAGLTIRAPHIPYTPYLHPTTKDWPKHMRPRAP